MLQPASTQLSFFTRLASAARLASLFLMLLLASCVDNSTDPSTTNNGKGGTDSSGFAIIAGIPDTLYYGEEAWITVNDLGSSVLDLKLFVHTVEVEKMRIEGNRLIFEVPRNASTGRLRLYKQDTLLAKNNFVLHVLPHHVNEFATDVQYFFPQDGYPGEIVALHVGDLPLRRREFDVYLGDSILPIESWNAEMIQFKIPEGVGNLPLTLRSFDRMIHAGRLEILAHGGVFLDLDVVHAAQVQATSLIGNMIVENIVEDSVNKSTFPSIEVYSYLAAQSGAQIKREDSVRINFNYKDDAIERTIEAALFPHPSRNTVSGRIVLKERSGPSLVEEVNFVTVIHVKDISWKLVQGSYVLYAFGDAITDNVTSLYHEMDQFGRTIIVKTADYQGGNPQSSFVLTFTP